MATLAKLASDNPNIEQQVREWQEQRRASGEDPNDWDAFRQHVTALGAPDPGGRPPDDFVGEEWKAQNPEWVARYADREG